MNHSEMIKVKPPKNLHKLIQKWKRINFKINLLDINKKLCQIYYQRKLIPRSLTVSKSAISDKNFKIKISNNF